MVSLGAGDSVLEGADDSVGPVPDSAAFFCCRFFASYEAS